MSLAWLKAFGVGAIVVSGPQSQEYWKPYAHPTKLEGILPVLWREHDVTFYSLPRHTAALAHVVPKAALVSHAPAIAADIGEIERYVSVFEAASIPSAQIHWRGSNHIRVIAEAAEGQVGSLQVSHHPGWHAQTQGRATPVHRDGLGLLGLDPQCPGRCEIQLDYDGGWELRFSRYLSFTALIALVALPLGFAVRRRTRP